ncbi:unnamed protein product [Cylindrotheca closterium]|uniref:J domain-containing protein n=1 Tax=Cylindrotheca closterium TaxID=2856 RepID=A0AAD2D1B1_9STRA|nr:unnamed protein product [Cylindrotheca closterium]
MGVAETLYDVLGVLQEASHSEIKAAFHKLARQSHPDKQNSLRQTTANLDFKRIQLAWETLGTAEKRQEYDDNLQQEELQERSRTHGAIDIAMDEVEEALDEETNETMLVYDCRCGEEVFLPVKQATGSLLVDCEGCCFVYRINYDE